MLAVPRCWLHPSCHWGFLIPVLTTFFHDNTYGFIRPDRQQHSPLPLQQWHWTSSINITWWRPLHQISTDMFCTERILLPCFVLRSVVSVCLPVSLSVCSNCWTLWPRQFILVRRQPLGFCIAECLSGRYFPFKTANLGPDFRNFVRFS